MTRRLLYAMDPIAFWLIVGGILAVFAWNHILPLLAPEPAAFLWDGAR